MTPVQATIKRVFDVAASCVGLVALAPVLLVVGLAVIATSRGPALFRQERVGKDGRMFRIAKFRTMYLHQDEANTVTIAGDSRVTPLGRFLRRVKLDEVPQLWNVLRGEMSLVGPRPDVREMVGRLQGEQRRILSVRPGITSPATLKYADEEALLAQQDNPVCYNREVIFPDKVRVNLEYIDNWSLQRDLWIIIQTLLPFLRDKDASA